VTHLRDSVSVVIPAFDSERTIERALASVCAQTVQADEIIVVDDGSRIPVESVLRHRDPRVRIVRQENAGAAAARNTGIREARGAWIAFLDADDEWLPTRLEAQKRALARHPDLGFLWGFYFVHVVDTAERTMTRPPCAPGKRLVLCPEQAFRVAYRVQTSTVLARRSHLLETPFDTSLRTAEDRDAWIRLFLKAPALCVDAPVAIHHEYRSSLSNTDLDCDARNMLEVIARYRTLLGPEPTRRREADVYRRWAAALVAAGRAPSAIGPAWQYLRREPASANAWYVALRTAIGLGEPRTLRRAVAMRGK